MEIVKVVAGNFNGSGGATSLNGLTDVIITAPTNLQILAYRASDQKWVNIDNSGGSGGGDASTLNGQNGAYYLNPANFSYSSTYTAVSQAEKASYAAKQTALGFTPENVANKNQANGYVGLDGTTKIDPAYLPGLAVNSIQMVANQAARLSLTDVQAGDAVKEQDTLITYMLSALPASTNSNWIQIGDMSPEWGVIDGKPTTFPPIIGSGATQAVAGNDPRLTDARAPVTNANLTGTPTAPTAPVGTSTTQVATTAFVQGNKTKVYVSASAPTGGTYNDADLWITP